MGPKPFSRSNARKRNLCRHSSSNQAGSKQGHVTSGSCLQASAAVRRSVPAPAPARASLLPSVMGGGGGRPTTTWREVAAAAVVMWLLPVVLTLAVFWLPLLCCAVAAVRFRRVRSRRLLRGCCGGGGGWRAETVDAGDRLRLLHQYLEDQMELVGADDAGALLDPAKPQ
ncbi:uncharacterized protein LOC133906355 [Phragmites australis]|uniref:uncharacterized protein LOC133906355 n=1 Tax=Phragmites australis TaxID=29695 RepID=UPI002D793297|nr:uncharacterized protein LOC133906355 [Phragmites australis]